MNYLKILFFSVFLFFSCKFASQGQDNRVHEIVETAKDYLGTRYKYAGTTKRGMDCSGLMYTTFLKHNIKLPRTSLQQSALGESVRFSNLRKGDLLFFRNPNSRNIDHVGLIVSRENDDIRFIHSSSSKGVIISSLEESYWKKTFIKGKRLLNSPSPSVVKNKSNIHKVVTGDTLYSISKKYNVTVDHIKELNSLKSNDISIGMVLRIQ